MLQDFRDLFCKQALKVTPFSILKPLTLRLLCLFFLLEIFNFCFKWPISLLAPLKRPRCFALLFQLFELPHPILITTNYSNYYKFFRCSANLQPAMSIGHDQVGLSACSSKFRLDPFLVFLINFFSNNWEIEPYQDNNVHFVHFVNSNPEQAV